ncbi:AAA family ATPase [Pseudomonas aeruginosa]|uniref:ATP-dependent nuclease n=1 Tax=Pseudomonas TaxID=286 RepID=UPI00215771DD|nr:MULTISPECIES: AAA family ATPase [Pseudomonas]MCO2204961.1 DUF2813 domain-containing protein [Pseudomonas aeruginosa]MCO2215878.1 DUF2813 domain-containing protein [Pseudomonas aeruginosa]MCO2220531.1 DUF2813 domain-containing protein [Pseudomonas aeruginosa]MCO2243206.1 DUF2813 domain-containing protein [Pseudomonas aeruginosa]MCO2263188.1 DUF2813 domain-containing protein [Pseudomonas aeruginosa]
MKLKKIYIEKFRAIRYSEIKVSSELALVGQNSSGKSSILRALNSFFNFEEERKNFESGRHSFQKTSIAVITLDFDEVPVACRLPRSGAGSEIRARLKYKKSDVWQIFDGNDWIPAPADFHEELQKYISYVYVPLRRDHEVAGWGDTGLLKRAVEAWLINYTSRRDTISPKVVELSKIVQGKAFDGLGKHLRKVTPLVGAFQFNVAYRSSPDYSFLLKDIFLSVSEGSTTVDLEDCGSGTQSMAAFALYSYLAELKGNTFILGIEEPEVNLHPQAQKELLHSLKKMPLQVLFTTHSTVMIDELDHEEVVLCRRITSQTRGFEVVTKQLSPDFWNRNAMDRGSYYQFYKRRNSEFFFSNFITICESPIDAEIIRHLLRIGGADPIKHSVSIIALDGVGSLPYVYNLLKELGFSFCTVVDKDYFLPYLNDELSKSRNNSGFPKYKNVYNTTCLIEEMIPQAAKRAQLLTHFHKNHSRAMDILEEANVFCFRWSLEIDLVATPSAEALLYALYNTPQQNRNTSELLINNRKSLKRLDKVLPVTTQLTPKNLPNSYKRIRKKMAELVRGAALV